MPRKVNYKVSYSNSFCCCTYSEEYIIESLQPEPSFPPHPPDVTWLGMQKNTTISIGELSHAHKLTWEGGCNWTEWKVQKIKSIMQNSCKTNNSNVSCKEPTPHDKHVHKRRELGSDRPNGGYSEGSPEGDESSIYSERGPPTIFKLLNKTWSKIKCEFYFTHFTKT